MVGGFKSFRSAAITLAGIELAHRIRKRQFSFGRGRYQKLRVTKANLGPSIRVAPPGSESSNLRSGPDSRPEPPISTPLMYRFLFEDGGLLYRGHINVLNFPFRETSLLKHAPDE